MGDRYTTRYSVARPRSPTHNPARASLPINLAYPYEQPHVHIVPVSRPDSRTNDSAITNGGTITTTYKVTAEPARGSSHVRDGSHLRRSTLDNHNRPIIPAIVTTTTSPRHRPVVHSTGGFRSASPVKDPYRSSQEEYVTIPATSRHGGHHHHHHTKRYSATMDNADMNRLAQENGRLRIAPVREPNYTNTRSRPTHSASLVRRADNVADDYGDDGYGYTNAADLVRYDLANSHPQQQQTRTRRDNSISGAGSRPVSVTGYADAPQRPYDGRERGPPPSMRGFEKINVRAPSWDQTQATARMPVAPMPPPPMSAVESSHRPNVFEPAEPVRRTSSTRTRPTSMYHDRDPRRTSRDERYEVRDDDARPPRVQRDRYDDSVEERGFGLRPERAERIERPHSKIDRHDETGDRIERSHSRADRGDRHERTERSDRDDRNDRSDRLEKDRSEHRSRDALATGLGLAGAALGIKAVKNAARNDREDSDERDEKRRERRDRDDRDSVDLSGRDPKEKRRSDDSLPSRDSQIPPPPRDNPAEPRERQSSKDERDSDAERRERHRRRTEAALAGTATTAAIVGASDSRSDTSEDIKARIPRRKRDSAPAFNPRDPMDLKAMQAELNAKESKSPTRGADSRVPPEITEVRKDVEEDRRPREIIQPVDAKQTRVVSPPREKVEEKPVKGILRAPKKYFPEDPAPLREGVAPLKDSKKDGIPPDARWTKISRKLVNPEALELGKERYEVRDDSVIVLRVLSREEVQGYAEVTAKLRQNREEFEELEALERRKKRRARHEEQKREREQEGKGDKERRHHRRERERESESSTDSEDGGDRVLDRPKMLEGAKKKQTFDEALMSGGLGGDAVRETVSIPQRRDDRREER